MSVYRLPYMHCLEVACYLSLQRALHFYDNINDCRETFYFYFLYFFFMERETLCFVKGKETLIFYGKFFRVREGMMS